MSLLSVQTWAGTALYPPPALTSNGTRLGGFDLQMRVLDQTMPWWIYIPLQSPVGSLVLPASR